MKKIAVVMLLCAAALGAAAQEPKNTRPPRFTSVEPTLRAAGLESFLELLSVVGLKELGVAPTSTAAGPGGGPRYHTLFVPTGLALARMSPGTLDALKRDPARLRAFLLAHLVEGEVTIGELPMQVTDGTSRATTKLKTRAGTVLQFQPSARRGTQFPEINGRARVGAFQDVRVSDFRLVIHEIDAVLMADGSV
jgi:uncharacterized surface protein with fasciclin (FAS1) repeats